MSKTEREKKLKRKVKKLKAKVLKYKSKARRYGSVIENFKAGIICSICLDTITLPFTLQCGHSFCYSCIRSWISSSKNFNIGNGNIIHIGTSIDVEDGYDGNERKSPCCPSCRANITQVPFRNTTIGQQAEAIVSSRTNKSEYEEYVGRKQHEVNLYVRDSCNDTINVWESYLTKEGIIDVSDGLRRCTRCLWEIVGTECSNCGQLFGDNGGDVYDDGESMDEEEFEQDESYLGTDAEFEEEMVDTNDSNCQFIDDECSEDDLHSDVTDETDGIRDDENDQDDLDSRTSEITIAAASSSESSDEHSNIAVVVDIKRGGRRKMVMESDEDDE